MFNCYVTPGRGNRWCWLTITLSAWRQCHPCRGVISILQNTGYHMYMLGGKAKLSQPSLGHGWGQCWHLSFFNGAHTTWLNNMRVSGNRRDQSSKQHLSFHPARALPGFSQFCRDKWSWLQLSDSVTDFPLFGVPFSGSTWRPLLFQLLLFNSVLSVHDFLLSFMLVTFAGNIGWDWGPL